MIIKKNDDRDLLSTDVIGSSVARSKRWLVAIVRICHEKKTGERLTKMGIENFLPIQQEVHQWSDRRKIVDRVLLPMMIFQGLRNRLRRSDRHPHENRRGSRSQGSSLHQSA